MRLRWLTATCTDRGHKRRQSHEVSIDVAKQSLLQQKCGGDGGNDGGGGPSWDGPDNGGSGSGGGGGQSGGGGAPGGDLDDEIPF